MRRPATMKDENLKASEDDYGDFKRLYLLTHVVGLAAFAIVILWMGLYRGG